MSPFCRYNHFYHRRLIKDLERALEERKKYEDLHADLTNLEGNIRALKEDNLSELRTLVEIGADTHVQAQVADTSYIFIQCGLGFHVEVTLDEALSVVIPMRLSEAAKAIDMLSRKVAQIKAQIRFIQDGIKNATTPGGKE